MPRTVVTALRTLALSVAAGAFLVAGCGSTPRRSVPTAIGVGLHGSAGTQATVYARGIPEMSAFAFDARGRLWVTRSGSSRHSNGGVYVVSCRGA
ncbi:MAG: hypothetical protein ACJ77E_07180, partial [Gaiellaceae bacterium]